MFPDLAVGMDAETHRAPGGSSPRHGPTTGLNDDAAAEAKQARIVAQRALADVRNMINSLVTLHQIVPGLDPSRYRHHRVMELGSVGLHLRRLFEAYPSLEAFHLLVGVVESWSHLRGNFLSAAKWQTMFREMVPRTIVDTLPGVGSALGTRTEDGGGGGGGGGGDGGDGDFETEWHICRVRLWSIHPDRWRGWRIDDDDPVVAEANRQLCRALNAARKAAKTDRARARVRVHTSMSDMAGSAWRFSGKRLEDHVSDLRRMAADLVGIDWTLPMLTTLRTRWGSGPDAADRHVHPVREPVDRWGEGRFDNDVGLERMEVLQQLQQILCGGLTSESSQEATARAHAALPPYLRTTILPCVPECIPLTDPNEQDDESEDAYSDFASSSSFSSSSSSSDDDDDDDDEDE